MSHISRNLEALISFSLTLALFGVDDVDSTDRSILSVRVRFSGKTGPKRPLPDHVIISEPKREDEVTKPYSDVKGNRPAGDAAQPIQSQVQL